MKLNKIFLYSPIKFLSIAVLKNITDLLLVKGSPRNLRVFDETESTMKLSWQAAPGNVLEYHIAYKPEGGEKNEISVKGDSTTATLKNLLADTEYEIFVSARYSSGLGAPLLGKGTTLEGNLIDICFTVLNCLSLDVGQSI